MPNWEYCTLVAEPVSVSGNVVFRQRWVLLNGASRFEFETRSNHVEMNADKAIIMEGLGEKGWELVSDRDGYIFKRPKA